MALNEKEPSEAKIDMAVFPRPSPCWNIISVLSPILVGLPVLYVGTHPLQDSGWGWGAIGAMLIAMAASCIVGLTTGVIALCRRERLSGISIVALLINGYPILHFLFGMLTGFSGR